MHLGYFLRSEAGAFPCALDCHLIKNTDVLYSTWAWLANLSLGPRLSRRASLDSFPRTQSGQLFHPDAVVFLVVRALTPWLSIQFPLRTIHFLMLGPFLQRHKRRVASQRLVAIFDFFPNAARALAIVVVFRSCNVLRWDIANRARGTISARTFQVTPRRVRTSATFWSLLNTMRAHGPRSNIFLWMRRRDMHSKAGAMHHFAAMHACHFFELPFTTVGVGMAMMPHVLLYTPGCEEAPTKLATSVLGRRFFSTRHFLWQNVFIDRLRHTAHALSAEQAAANFLCSRRCHWKVAPLS